MVLSFDINYNQLGMEHKPDDAVAYGTISSLADFNWNGLTIGPGTYHVFVKTNKIYLAVRP